MTDPDRDHDRLVVVVIPVLSRLHRIVPVLESLDAATPEPHRTFLVASENYPDVVTFAAGAVRHFPDVELEVLPPNRRGDYAYKINHIIRITDEPFIFAAADDVAFHPGWMPAALRPFADPTVGVVGTQDLGNPRVIAGRHATHLMFRRTYVELHGTIDEPGKALHEGYLHEYVDDEAVGTAKARGAWQFAGDSVVEHLHPHWGKAESDAVYDQQLRRMALSRSHYARRRPKWLRP